MRLGLRLTALVLLALGAFGGAVTARAQDSVAGAPPVFTKPADPAPPADKQQPLQGGRIRVESPLVTTPVIVIDRAGEFVYDLNERDFKILDDGVPQQIQRFDLATDPVALVIVVEADDSVAPLFDHIHPLGPIFSSLMLGKQGEAAVMSYADQIKVEQDFSRNSDQLSATLAGLKAFGTKARLNDALARAVAMLKTRPKTERRVIVVFSDGFDHGSETTPHDVVDKATAAEVTIYGLGFSPAEALLKQKPADRRMSPLDANVSRPLPPGMVPTPTNSDSVWGTSPQGVPIITAAGEIIRSKFASSPLELYAGYTGGVFYSHWSKNALQDQLSRVSSEVNSQYEIAYVPDTLKEPGFHTISVEVSKPGLKVRSRAGYFYTGNSSQ